MSRRLLLLVLSALLLVSLGDSTARAAIGPSYDIRATWGDTNLPPGGEGQFTLQARNVGDATAEEKLFIVDQLPAGVTATNVHWDHFGGAELSSRCSGNGPGAAPGILGATTITCVLAAAEVPTYAFGYLGPIFVDVAIAPTIPEGTLGTNVAAISGGGAPKPFTDEDTVPFSVTPAGFGVVPSSFSTDKGSFATDVFTAAYPLGEPSRQAADHPFEQRVKFELNQYSAVSQEDGTRYTDSSALARTVEVTLPRGLIGNPETLPKCDPVDFAKKGAGASGRQCPADTQVGYLAVSIGTANGNYGRGGFWTAPNSLLQLVPVYNLVPPRGTPADLAFNAAGYVVGHIYAALDPAQNYAIKSITPDITTFLQISTRAAEATLWGVPGDPAHNRFRYYPVETEGKVTGAPFEATIRPFFTNPADCEFDNGGHRIRVESYNEPGKFTPVQEYPDPLNVEGCDDARFRFKPDISLQPTSRDAGGPTGLDVHLEVPQQNEAVRDAEQLYAANDFVKGISTPPIKRVVTTLPEGMTISPSAAQGLGSCTPEQIGLGTDSPVTCPDSSQYGTLTLHTPLLPVDEQPEGWIYIAKQNDNPNHNFLSIYLVVQEPNKGILVKIPGRIDLDPVTGQITTTFDDLPQFPVDDMQLSFKGGVRAGLVEPSTCGTKTITAEFFTWQDPATPHPVKDSYEITQKADGSPCVTDLAQRPFNPTLEAGTLNNTAGTYSPFVFRLTRTDDDQEFSQLGIGMPEGLTAKIAGVAECTEPGIAQAATPGRTGTEELNNPSCPESSLIGTTNVGSGVGVPLTYVPGKAYLAGPYRGAPLSMVAITPVITGPFDLGVVAVRSALDVDPETAEVSVATDPFPQIFQGIPVRLRDIRVRADRPEFTINPTSCAEKQITAHLTGTGGDVNSSADDTSADLSNRFQAAECASLGFRPKLHMRLFGGTKRGAHPKFRSVLTMPKQGANIDRAAVALPRSEFLDQGHIRTVCTRVQFAADRCPKGSIYGRAVANTPLLDKPLKGPIYLRSSSHKLPDLVARLRGRIAFNLVGRIDSVRGGIRTTFDLVPDAPVSKFVLTIQGGRKGLLINSRDLCRSTTRATANFGAQNGRRRVLRPKMRNACGKSKSKSKRAKRRRARRVALKKLPQHGN